MPFPDYPQVRDKSSIKVEAGTEAERMSNGTLRVRRMWSTPEAELVICNLLTTAQWDTLWAHYLANRDGQDTLRWRETNTTYTVRYAGAPERRAVGRMWEVTYRVLEV